MRTTRDPAVELSVSPSPSGERDADPTPLSPTILDLPAGFTVPNPPGAAFSPGLGVTGLEIRHKLSMANLGAIIIACQSHSAVAATATPGRNEA